jgi:hypothetical protein
MLSLCVRQSWPVSREAITIHHRHDDGGVITRPPTPNCIIDCSFDNYSRKSLVLENKRLTSCLLAWKTLILKKDGQDVSRNLKLFAALCCFDWVAGIFCLCPPTAESSSSTDATKTDFFPTRDSGVDRFCRWCYGEWSFSSVSIPCLGR